MATFYMHFRNEQQCEHTIDIDAPTADEAIAEANGIADGEAQDWYEDGEWGRDIASGNVRWRLVDGRGVELDRGSVTVTISPDHESPIRDAEACCLL